MKYANLLIIIFLSAILMLSCKPKSNAEVKRQPILEVEGKFLYQDQIQEIIPPSVSKEDSIEIAQKYIRKWVTDVLLYENAKRNVTDKQTIEDMVESYRKSLTIHQYQQKLIEQRLSKEPSDEEIESFYKQYGSQLALKENIIRGVLLVVPSKAKQMSDVRAWMQSCNEKSLEKIEKYSIQNAISYDYFGDKWVDFSEVLKKVPIAVTDPTSFVRSNRFFEHTDSAQHYFLRILSYQTIGQVEPFEKAREKIISILQNKRKSEFVYKFETELYDDAVKSGSVSFFNKNRN